MYRLLLQLQLEEYLNPLQRHANYAWCRDIIDVMLERMTTHAVDIT